MLSHLWQFKDVVWQKTHPVPAVPLHVKPVGQQPAALYGFKKNNVKQVTQVFAELHLVQLKLAGQATQPAPEVLHVTT